MKIRLKYVNLFLILLFGSVFLCGCSTKKIEFKRESSVTQLYNQLGISAPKQDTIDKSGKVFIYKMSDNEKNKKVNFGPKDLDFDFKVMKF